MSKSIAWKQFEQITARRMRDLGYDARRNWSTQFERHDAVDIVALPYLLQLKYGNKPNLRNAWVQANSQAKKGEIPVGVARYKGQTLTLVALSWKDFKTLIEREI